MYDCTLSENVSGIKKVTIPSIEYVELIWKEVERKKIKICFISDGMVTFFIKKITYILYIIDMIPAA